MEYKDKRCPVCGVPFDDNDDIVVCPECGTPQHRVCYERLGKCANAEKHGADFSWDKEEEQDLSICPSCGAKNPKDAMFCSACSHPLGNDASREQGQDARSSRPFGSSGNPQGVPFGFGSFDPSAVYSNLGISMGD
ncbi:MAG: RING finger protein, partial [Acutalibacteraceae bacterium]